MNKPVAFMNPTGLQYKQSSKDFMYNDSLYNPKLDWIPLYTHPVKEPDFTVEKDSQDWKGMDGATAFWLIERHSNHWDDARLMMEEWLKANSHPVKELTELDYAEFLPIWKDFIKDAGSVFNVQMVAHHFYNLALRKAQEK